jgi:hypothetical protein
VIEKEEFPFERNNRVVISFVSQLTWESEPVLVSRRLAECSGVEMKDPNVMQQARGVARLSSDTQARLAQQLRAMYADIIEEGLPERFARLLATRDLEQKDEH